MALSDQNKAKLDIIVSQASANGEAPETIQAIVNDFKAKYDVPQEPSTASKIGRKVFESVMAPPLMGLNVASDVSRIVDGEPFTQVAQAPTNMSGDLSNEVFDSPGKVLPAFGLGMGQTAALGQNTRILAALKSGLTNAPYDQTLQQLNADQEQVRAQTPTAMSLGNMAGMFIGAPKAILGRVGRVVAKVLPSAEATGLLGLIRGAGQGAAQGGVAGAIADASTNPEANIDSVAKAGTTGAIVGAIPPVIGGVIKSGANFTAAVGLKSPIKIGQAFNREIKVATSMDDVRQQASQKLAQVGEQRAAVSQEVAGKPVAPVKGVTPQYIRELASLESDPDVVGRLVKIADSLESKTIPSKFNTDSVLREPAKTVPGQPLSFQDAEYIKTISNKNSFTEKTATKKANNDAAYRRKVATRIDGQLKSSFPTKQAAEMYDKLNKRINDLFMIKLGAEKSLGSRESLSTTQIGANVIGNPIVSSILNNLGNLLQSGPVAQTAGYVTATENK